MQQVVDGEEILNLRNIISDVHLDDTLEEYTLALVQATREHRDISLGASPRGTLALYKTAQAYAVLLGRDYVLPDDIKQLTPLTLTHRLIVKPESQLRGRTAQGIIQEIIGGSALNSKHHSNET